MKVIPHSSFESLIDAISGELGKPLDSVIPIRVVVPSVAFEDNLQIRLADRLGVCMGVDLMMPQDFIRLVTAKESGRESESWAKEQLAWRILSKVHRYETENLGMNNPSGRDRFAMAGVIADQFDQYAHFRPSILEAWARNESFKLHKPSAGAIAAEEWQRQLWQDLNREIAADHPVLRMKSLRNDQAALSAMRKNFPEVLVLGTGSLDPLLVEVLCLLEEAGSDVTVRVLLPSLDYLGDLRLKNAVPPADADPEKFALEGKHPLLVSMGRHAIGAFHLLGKLDAQYTHWPEPVFGKGPESQALLNRLQQDILRLQEPGRAEVATDDISIRMHSCYGPRREMEVLRDEIQRAFAEIKDLKPDEVHIVAPSLEAYAPLVDAVLCQGSNPLKVQLTERPGSEKDPVVEGLQELLAISSGKRYEASSLMNLLHLKAVRNAVGIGDDEEKLERTRSWIRQCGVTRGLESVVGTGSWSSSQDRLVAGRFLGGIRDAKYPDGSFVLPVSDQLGGDTELMQGFQKWFFDLSETFRIWEDPATVAGWSERLIKAAETQLAGEDEALLALIPHVDFLKRLPEMDPVDAGTILDWFAAATDKSTRRTHKTGKITFGAVQHLQNIPCRVLCMVGMQDGAFPGESLVPAWDLLRAYPCLWDRNARIDDRQLFLDALLVPKERLIICAANRNVRTMKDSPFSSCVDELIRVMDRMGADSERLVIKHRLQPFSADYFIPDGKMPGSYDPKMATVAREIKPLAEKVKQPFWNANRHLDPEIPEEIALSDLISFWKDPAKAFIKKQGIRLPFDQQHDSDLDQSPITLGFLEKWSMKESILNGVISGSDLELLEAELKAGRNLPGEKLGSCYFNALLKGNLTLAEVIKKSIGESYAIALNVPLPNDRTVKLVGEARMMKDGSGLLAYGIGKMGSPKHFTAPWITSLAAVAQGNYLKTYVFSEKSPTEPSQHHPKTDSTGAAELLLLLIQGYLEGHYRPLHYAPKTSDKIRQGKDPMEAWINDRFGDAPGEGESEAALIAWRDRDPFENPNCWRRWVPVSEAIHQWQKVQKVEEEA